MKLRIVFFGTPEFAVESAKAIYNAGYEIAAVVTAPDKIGGRGHKLLQSDVKQWAIANNLPVLQPVNLKDEEFLQHLKGLDANLFVVIAFRMLPEAVWTMPSLGTFNLHASLLPRYRGAAPINHAIMNGDTETGVTTFFLRHEIDTGDIILQQSIKIEENDNAGSLHDKLMHLGAEVTLRTLDLIGKDEVNAVPQSAISAESSPAPKIFHHNSMIDWNLPADETRNFVRGLSPYPAARANLQFPLNNKEEYKIFEVKTVSEQLADPGKVLVADGKIFVGCGKGSLEILSLQAQGKRRLEARDFLNGLKSISK